MNEKIEIVKQPELFNETKKYIICLLTYQPTSDFLKLYLPFCDYQNYQVYVIVDDNEYDIQPLKKEFSTFHFVQIKETDCKKHGFVNFGFFVKNGEPSAWDKGIFYFSSIYRDLFDYVWFIEDDVFIPSVKNILNIDYKNNGYDLLVQKTDFKDKQDFNLCCKKLIDTSMLKSVSKSMVCACRISKHFFEIIHSYIKTHKNGFFIEFFFPTLATFYHLNIKKIDELKTIYFRHNFTIEEILENKTYLFHPVKDIKQQQEFWNVFNKKSHYVTYYDLKDLYSKIKIADFHKTNTYIVQRSIYKNKNDKNQKVIVENKNLNSFFIIQNTIDNKIFENTTSIQSFDEGIQLAVNMKKSFLCFHIYIEEVYQHPEKNVEIRLFLYPGLLPFIEIITYSEKDLSKLLPIFDLGFTGGSQIQIVIQRTNQFFDCGLSFDQNMEFSKLDKSVKYVKKNKQKYIEWIKLEKELYQQVHQKLGDQMKKIYKSNTFQNFSN